MRISIVVLLAAISGYCSAGGIGFGRVDGIKQYDLGATQQVNIYLESSSEGTNPNCIDKGRPYGHIRHSEHEEATINRMLGIAMAGHLTGKKIRLHSYTDSCEIDFVAIQESVF